MVTKNEINEIINESKHAEEFLKKRNLFDVDAENFAVNYNSKILKNFANSEITDTPFVTFSSCTHPFIANLKISDKEFLGWLENNSNCAINSHTVTIIPESKKRFDLDSITFNDDYNGYIHRYTEFIENGYVEQGFTFPLIYDMRQEKLSILDLCRTTGLFWAFLVFIKKYYNWMKFDQSLDVRLIVHNSNSLTLSGFGGKNEHGNNWPEPTGMWWDQPLPATYRPNLEIKKTINAKELSNVEIPKIAKEFSDRLANAYNFDFSRCYNHDGTFSFDNFTNYND